MTIIAEILSARKNSQLVALPPTATVRNALQLMADRDVGSVLLMEGDALMGIFTERDYARRIVLQGLSSIDTPLANVMTSRLYVVGPRQTVLECLSIMSQGRMRHLPVVEGGKVLGMVSVRDLVNAQLEEQHFLVKQLENYIAGYAVP
ncbi:MAG: CBS domain-containing protein [Betaproteobacteria bacterium]|nr:CBS domain-containing protein [Betaproteobacteria bacterium]